MNFDYLKNKIVEAGEVAFAKIRQDHPEHTFYFFGLYTSGEYNYLLPTCSSFQGLEQVAEEYKLSDSYKDQSLVSLKNELKWSHCDSPLHLIEEESFDCLADDMETVFEELNALYDEKNAAPFEAYIQTLESCIISALKTLDEKGIFGDVDQRKQVLISLVMGDQSNDEIIRLAAQLNSAELVNNLRTELINLGKAST